MMVSDDGEVKTARQGKGLRNLLIVLVVILLATTALLYVLWDRSMRDTAKLRQAVAAYQRHLSSMGVDEEDLSSLLAVYRPIPESADETPAQPEATPPARSPAPEPASPKTASLPEPPTEAEPPLPAMEDLNDAAPLVSPVGIEDFGTSIGELSGALTVECKVTNIDPDLEKAEGHVILVLRPDADGDSGGLALPPVTLVGGRPTGNDEGKAFSISNFKRIRFTAGEETQPDRFRVATLFVFNNEGDLWLEEDFPIRTEPAH